MTTAFNRVWVTAFTRGGTTVSWNLSPNLKDSGPYRFMLEFAPAITSVWRAVSPEYVTDAVSLIDTSQRLFGVSDSLFYRVRLVTGAGTYRSNPVSYLSGLTRDSWLKAKELVRQAELEMRTNPDVEKGCLYKRRIAGQRCPNGADPVSGGCRLQGCPVCYETGIAGGYYPPVDFPILFGSVSKTLQLSEQQLGVSAMEGGSAKSLASVLPESNDIWISSVTDKRYFVNPTQPVQIALKMQHFAIQYQFALGLIPRGSIVYDLPRDGCPAPVSGFGDMSDEAPVCDDVKPLSICAAPIPDPDEDEEFDGRFKVLPDENEEPCELPRSTAGQGINW